MIFRVEITTTAEQDLSDIFDFIAYEQCLPKTASELIEKFHKDIASLCYMPERYRRFEQEPWFSLGLRVRYCSSYGIYYTVDERQSVVRIHRVLSNKVDVARWFKMN